MPKPQARKLGSRKTQETVGVKEELHWLEGKGAGVFDVSTAPRNKSPSAGSSAKLGTLAETAERREQGGPWTGKNILSSSLLSLCKTGNSSTLLRQPASLATATQSEKGDLCISNVGPPEPTPRAFCQGQGCQAAPCQRQ